MSRIILSSKQYNMLRICLTNKVFSQEEAAHYLQTTFSSMARRSYIATGYNARSGEVEFQVTNQAKAAMAQYENSDVMRLRQSDKLSVFLERYVKRSLRSRSA